MKRGITVVSVTIMVVLVIILASTITISVHSTMQNANKLAFALEISSIQEEISNYINENSEETYPIKENTYTISLASISENSVSQFNDEEKDENGNITLYELDLEKIGITDRQYGNKDDDKDVYALSLTTNKIYYLKGIKTTSKTYYTLTQDLIDIKEKNEKIEAEETIQKPIITTTAFSVNTINSDKKDIYLTNIKVDGDEITKIKYERELIDEDTAYEYFKYHGNTLSGDKIKVNEGDYVTIYAENSSGKWSIRQEGICKIPEGFYYVGGSIPTGVVISDSLNDTNRGTATDGDVVSAGLSGNQFVWVPVEDINEFIPREGYYNSGLQTYISDGTVQEPYNPSNLSSLSSEHKESIEIEKKEYDALNVSVERYNGFYIGRYEAGTTIQRTDTENKTSADLLVQKGKYPYNYVGCMPKMTIATGDVVYKSKNQGAGAVELSRGMYSDSSQYGVVSHLVYGIEWDATMYYMKDVKNINNSNLKYIINSNKMGGYSKTLQLTGENDNYKVKNIFDLAGNVMEYTMEVRYHVDNSVNDVRLLRGGDFNTYGNYYPASSRFNGGGPSNCFETMGFRIALYIV